MNTVIELDNTYPFKKIGCFVLVILFASILFCGLYYKFFIMTIPVSYEITGTGLLDDLQYSVPGAGISQAESYEQSPIKVHFYIANNKTADFIFKSRVLRSKGLTLKIQVNNKVFYSETTDASFNVDLKYNPQNDK